MNLRYLAYISDIVWVLPAFRQFSGRYKNYFIIVGLAGIISNTLQFIPHFMVYVNYTGLFMSALLVATAWGRDNSSQKKYVQYALLIVVSIIFMLFREKQMNALGMLFLHLLVMLIFLSNVVLETVSTKSVNLFLFMMVLYELSIVVRFFMAITSTVPSIYYYHFSIIFEMLVGLFFSIFVEENPKFHIKLAPELP